MSVRILIGDCVERMRELPDASVDSVVCDPPYHLQSIVKRFASSPRSEATENTATPYGRTGRGFMGQTWDGGDVAFRPETWAEVLRVLKPGGHLVAFSGTRTYHRMAVAIEDAGFEVRDMILWHYGSGFPKSHDISKAIDKAAGAEREVVGTRKGGAALKIGGDNPRPWHERQAARGGEYDVTEASTTAAREWEGWGTALKPATEPICLARKPLSEKTIAANVLKWGTGALNIDGCRIEADLSEMEGRSGKPTENKIYGEGINRNQEGIWQPNKQGRWPANLCHDGSDEVVAAFPDAPGQLATVTGDEPSSPFANIYGDMPNRAGSAEPRGDSGSAARFFYCGKATAEERGEGNNHPTVKPVSLMRWLVRLVTPRGGVVLDPFMGSGSTALACDAEQFDFIGCELSPEYAAIAEQRIRNAAGMFAEVAAA